MLHKQGAGREEEEQVQQAMHCIKIILIQQRVAALHTLIPCKVMQIRSGSCRLLSTAVPIDLPIGYLAVDYFLSHMSLPT